ncbi:hypothetical protein HMPREF0322_04127 [Desulfitobacterium hafniense DP7]|uniref:Uncharacterized protein n=1 Tax=Desulfitobacterium hafniense DP7 TaxID=537010 RepID=G9XT21_DESHA|nr:hypothetical protein HMPREF0322_04127 [Desulfitobacterium hafniense DP7]
MKDVEAHFSMSSFIQCNHCIDRKIRTIIFESVHMDLQPA